MKIICEGPDNSGKTTLAQSLAKNLNLEYRRPPTLSSTEGVNDAVFLWWERELFHHEHESAVYDRCTYISDPIYRLVSGKAPLREQSVMMAGVAQVTKQAFLIFCLPRWELSKALIEREMAEGGGLQGMDLAHAEVVHWAYFIEYQSWFHRIPHQVSCWNFENDNREALQNIIEFRIKEAM